MTKIKNTKKGMAKKTLSMSLVVAMLATSNVPVWAAEFSDGSDVTVTSDAEASVAETFSDDVTETPVVEDTTDNTAVATAAEVSSDSFSVTPEFTDSANNAIKDNAVTWGTTVKAKFKVTAKDNKAIDSNIKFHYAWKVNGTADSATDILTPTNDQTVTRATVATEAGKTLTLFVYATDSNDNNKTVWSYTSEGIAVKAIDVSQLYLSASVDGTHTYNGKPQEIASSGITLTLNDGKKTHGTVKANDATVGANFKVVQSGDHTNATKKATVTLVPQADGYTGQISTTYEIEPKTLDGTKDKLISEHMEATLLTSAFTYTGKVIRVKKDDIKLIDKETKEDLSNYIYADKDGYVSISAGNANNLATNVDDVAYARINLIIGTPETGSFKNYKITADGSNHRTIETTNTFKVTSRDLSDINVSIKAKTYNNKKKVTIDKDDITFTDKNGNTLDLYKDVVITVPDNATDIGSYKVTITPTELNKNVTGTTTADFNIVGTDISGGTFANEKSGKLNNKEYTGEQIVITKDDLGTLTIGGKAVSPTLYELVNGTNTNVEDGGYVIVKGLGDYAGSEKKITFAINPAVISEVKVTNKKVEKLDTTDFSDYKDSMKLVVKAKNGAKPAKEFTLVEGKDYKVEYSCANHEIGQNVTATVTEITNKNFTNSKNLTLSDTSTLTAKTIKSENIKLKETNFTYTGKAVEPKFDVVIDGKVINPQYYTATYSNNLNAGTATLTVKGDGTHYSDVEAKITYEIKPANAADLKAVIGSKEYTGYSLAVPASDIDLTLKGNPIDVASNFTLTYGENLQIGEGTVTLTPKNGNFTGTLTATFQISGEMLNAGGKFTFYDENGIKVTSPFFTYNGKEHQYTKTTFTYTDSTKKLTEGQDYEIKYVDNVYGKEGAYTSEFPKAQYVAVIAVAKGKYASSKTNAYGLKDGIYTDAEGNKITNVMAVTYIKLNQLSVVKSNVSVSNGVYAGGLPVKPVVSVVVNGVTLKEGQDYDLDVSSNTDVANATISNSLDVTVKPKNGYTTSNPDDLKFKWGIDKFNLANADVTVDGDKVTVKCGRVDVETSEYTVEKKDGKVTVTAKKDSKNYTGSKTVDAATQDQKPAAPMISSVKVVGNKATAILSGDSEGAAGYDYVISTDRDCITNKDYDSVNKNQVQTSTTFKYVQQGTYYAYCHAWKRDENGKKVFSDWSNAYPFVVSAITPDAPVITNVTVSGSTIKVTYKAAANATGYDVVLGTDSKKENGETRPYHYGDHKVLNLKEGTVTATFKNVPKGTWVVGMHAFNRTSEDGTKVFSPWSNLKKATVK